MYENLSIQEYVRRMQEWDFEQEVKRQEVIERCWEDAEPKGNFKTKKQTQELLEALNNGE